MAMTLEEKLKAKSNDYSAVETDFRRRTGHSLVRGGSCAIGFSDGCSVIIPFHGERTALAYALAALRSQNLPVGFKKEKVEIIVINDGAKADVETLLRRTAKIYPIRYLICGRNQGRAFARNVGLLYAKNEIIIFLDADMVVQPNFLAIHMERQAIIEGAVIVGFREDISHFELKKKFDRDQERILLEPEYRADFRYQRSVPRAWRSQFPWLSAHNFGRSYRLLTMTDYWKDFGLGREIGIWELPSMVLTSNASARRQDLLYAWEDSIRLFGAGD